MTTSPSATARAHAARAILEVVQHNRTIDWVQRERPQWSTLPLERELIFGTIRHYRSLSALVGQFLPKPLRSKDQDLSILLLVGAYQLRYSSIPAHAIINETVQAAVALRKPWARGLLNAILRRIDKDKAVDHQDPDQTFDHPPWLATALRQQYPHLWRELLAANNTRAPMTLRVNAHKISRDAYAEKLRDADIAATAGLAPQSLILLQPQASASLPGWTGGEVAIQDMGAQFAAGLLPFAAVATRMPRVLDACAAPGGKLAHLLESLPADAQDRQFATITALDVSAARADQTRQIAGRLGHRVAVEVADATSLDWWDGVHFSHILLDAPCSGTGTIRRHPDIKLLLQPDAPAAHRTLQLQMLNNLWQTLAPGGNLLYCTCSLLCAENDDVVSRFLELQHKDATVQKINLPSGAATQFGWQLLPTDPNTDGFYYALLRKSPHKSPGAADSEP